MNDLRKLIKESFFNPLIHFSPLLLFILLFNVVSLQVAWIVTGGVALVTLIYIHYNYKKTFNWFLYSSFIFVFVATITTIVQYGNFPEIIKPIAAEITTFGIFGATLILRRNINQLISKANTKLFSMQNNLNEMYRTIIIIGCIMFIYIAAHIGMQSLDFSSDSIEYSKFLYFGALLFVGIYLFVRVSIVRVRLLREEWWPIVNNNGTIIGSIQHQLSLFDDKKYMHPIVRVMVIDDNRIYLQKRAYNDVIFPGMWDTAISNHIRLNENPEACVMRTANERYGIESIKPIFLSNYIHETEHEFHYVFLYVACYSSTLSPNKEFIDLGKWWTRHQIESNLKDQIFTDNFSIEFDIITRSGLLEPGVCNCDCRLKQTIQDGILRLSKLEYDKPQK